MMNARPIGRKMFLCPEKAMARRRELTDEERRERSRAACAKWREKNREAIRERSRALSAIPSVAQQLSLYRKVLYAVKKQALLDAGYTPNPVGRPRVQRSSDGIAGGPLTNSV